MTSRPIDTVVVGERHRRDLGNIEALAKSIATVGLLHPIVVTPNGVLIAGERRLAAYRQLGWPEVPVTVVDIAEIVTGEFAENVDRKNFLPSEIDAIRRTMEPGIKAAATSRKVSGRSASEAGETRDKIGAFAGVSGRTVEKIAAVVAAAEANPERFGMLAKDMDRTGRVDGPFRRLRVARQAEIIRSEPPPLPDRGPYRVIVADPPWPYELSTQDPSHRATHPYPQISIAQIRALPVQGLAHEDSILWLWTTNFHMREAFDVLEAWGFAHRTMLTWVKDRPCTGAWLRGQTEHCLMAVRGKPVVQLTNETTALSAPLRAHSEKPEAFYALVERLCPAPRYAELFSRQQRPNWDGHGDESQVP